ncbi:MAG: prepilin-type N-terminal cleavage/methylation domain-containing protein [Planctomycetota bacterium]
MIRAIANPKADGPRAKARGFSLIEVVIVCIMLAMVASTVVPRFLVLQRQREEKSFVEIEDLMRMYAFRNAAGTQQIGLYFNRGSNELTLWIYDLNPNDPEGPRTWQQDRLSNAVALPDGVEVVRAMADEILLDRDEWNITSYPDGSRPRIEIELAGTEKQALLVLEPYASVPVRADDPRAILREPIDLDSQGSPYDPW